MHPCGDADLWKLARSRIAIEGVQPAVDAGRFAAKAVLGWPLTIEADIFCDGHEVIAAALEWRACGEEGWHETPLRFRVNDRWEARSEEHTSELQSRGQLVCRLLLEKKKTATR